MGGKANKDIRDYLERYYIKNWQLAKELGVHETTLCRWLRYELSNDKKDKILKAIERIKESRA